MKILNRTIVLLLVILSYILISIYKPDLSYFEICIPLTIGIIYYSFSIFYQMIYQKNLNRKLNNENVKRLPEMRIIALLSVIIFSSALLAYSSIILYDEFTSIRTGIEIEDNVFSQNLLGYEDYFIDDEGNGIISIHKISDDAYERTIILSDYKETLAYEYVLKLEELNLVIVEMDYENNSLLVSLYELDNANYLKTIEGTITGGYMYLEEEDVHIIDDYIVIWKYDWGSYCCIGDPNTVYIYNISDTNYERIITRELPYTYSCEGYDVKIDMFDHYIVFTDFLDHGGLGSITIYDVFDSDFEKVIVGTAGIAETIPMYIEGDYIFVAIWNDAHTEKHLNIYKFSDDSYLRSIFINSNRNYSLDEQIFIQEDYLIIGSDAYNHSQGAVYIYKLSDSDYRRVITGSETNYFDRFGYIIQPAGNMILVQAPGYNGDLGALFIYSLTDVGYERIILGVNSYGKDIWDVYGDYILIHDEVNYYCDANCYPYHYRLYIYKISDPDYEMILTLEAYDEIFEIGYCKYKDTFLAIYDDYLFAASSWNDSDTGIVEVYDLTSTDTEPILLEMGEDENDKFGKRFYYDGESIVIYDFESYQIFIIE